MGGSTGLSLRVGTLTSDRLRVRSFRGVEALSAAYAFDVVASARGLDAGKLEATVLGQRSSLRIERDDAPARIVNGVVVSARVDGAEDPSTLRLRVRIAPELALRKRRRNSRIFQEKTTKEIVDAILDEANLLRDWHVKRGADPKEPREYSTQYEESDYAFVRRMAGEEGWLFWFEQPDASVDLLASATAALPRERMIICDEASSYAGLDGGAGRTLLLRDDAALDVASEHVRRFALRAAVRETAATHKDWDPLRPRLDLSSTSANEAAESSTPRLEHYDHHGELLRPDVDEERTATHLEQLRRFAAVARGESTSSAFAPGFAFTVDGHAVPAMNARWVLTRVEHVGKTPDALEPGAARVELYSNRFWCAPAAVPVRLPKPKRRVVQALESAIVVGESRQEISVDGQGRIKVQFHWDREGKHDAKSSCWIRVLQPWAGAGWGSMFLPRVGMEVMVAFLGGDVDKPVALGAVYNTANATAHALPASASRAGIRSQSTPGGGGFNELSFEDKKGQEQLYFRAERDRVADVRRDDTLNVGGERRVKIVKGETLEIGGTRKSSSRGHVDDSADGNRTLRTGGNAEHVVKGGSRAQVGGNEAASIGGDASLRVAQNWGIVVGTNGAEQPNTMNLHVFGDHLSGATGLMKLQGDGGISLICGDSSLTITKDSVEIKSKTVKISGSQGVVVAGKGPSFTLDDKAELRADSMKFFAKDAWIKLDENFSTKGKLVKLNCDDEKPTPTDDDADPPKMMPFKMKLTDADFAPYKSKKYQLLVDGATFEGTTDADGHVEKDVPEGAKAITVVCWTGDYPTGEKRTWSIKKTTMAAPTEVPGAQLRLANLGYYHGDPTSSLDAPTKAALASFQSDAGLPPSGELDAATAAAISKAHGS